MIHSACLLAVIIHPFDDASNILWDTPVGLLAMGAVYAVFCWLFGIKTDPPVDPEWRSRGKPVRPVNLDS